VRKLTDDVPSLNVHHLSHAGCLVSGTVSRWVWADTTIILRAEAARLVLTIGGHEVVVPIAWFPGMLGGEWPLFHCPRCNRRTWHLYLVDHEPSPICRLCGRVGYATNLERSPTLWRVRRLRRQLGCTDLRPFSPLPPRGAKRGWAALEYATVKASIMAAECRVIVAIDRMAAAAERRKQAHERQQRRRQRGRDPDAGSA
jgi:hypothetical protein